MDLLTQSDWVILILSLIAIGSLGGFLAGLLGIGGGMVTVPALLYVFTWLGFSSDVLMHVCVGTSLALIVPTGFSSARAHYKRGHVDMELVKLIGGGILIGVAAGTIIANFISSLALKYLFASVFPILAVMMLAGTRNKHLRDTMPSKPVTTAIGSLIGTLSTLIGVGGATMNVPFMSTCGVNIHRAIGTASALGLFIAVPAVLGFMFIGFNEVGRPPYSFGYINIPAFLCIMPVSVVVAKLGAYAAHKAPVKVLRKIFALFMIIVSIKLWSDLL